MQVVAPMRGINVDLGADGRLGDKERDAIKNAFAVGATICGERFIFQQTSNCRRSTGSWTR